VFLSDPPRNDQAQADTCLLAADKRLEEAREKWHLVPDAAIKAYLPVALVPGYLKKLERSRASLMRKVVTSPQWMRQLRLLKAVRSEAI